MTLLTHEDCIPLTFWHSPEYGLVLKNGINALLDSGKAWFVVNSSSEILFDVVDSVLEDPDFFYLQSFKSKPIRIPSQESYLKRFPPYIVFHIHCF